MAQPYIDAHCHLADPRIFGNVTEIIRRSEEAGVGTWIQGGVDPEDWKRQLTLKEKWGPKFVTAFGLHPWWVAKQEKATVLTGLEALKSQLSQAQALGETGLDHGEKHDQSRDLQLWAFEQQLELALAFQKPLVLHIVQAHEEALKVLEKRDLFPNGGLVHSFSGTVELAIRYRRLGFLLSVSGVVTRPGHKALKETLKTLPPDSFVIETDSPDQPLGSRESSQRGYNEPANLLKIAETVAEIRRETAEAVLERNRENLSQVFLL